MRSAAQPVDAPAPVATPSRPSGRLFTTQYEEPRARRASDVLLLFGALLGLLFLGAVAIPRAGIERAVIRFLHALPFGFTGLGPYVVDLLLAWAILLIVAAAFRRRWSLVLDTAIAIVVGTAIVILLGRVVAGAWPPFGASLRDDPISSWFPSVRFVLAAVVVLAASPRLIAPARRIGRWLIGLALLAITVTGAAVPTAASAGFLVAVIAAATVHLLLGSSRGRPDIGTIVTALHDLGAPVATLGVADRQRAGSFVFVGSDDQGADLVVKVYGRDAADTQFVTTVCHTLWYRESGSPSTPGRLRQVEHEALLTLLAAQAGVVTDQVVTAGVTSDDDAVLVLRRRARRYDAENDPVPVVTIARGLWSSLGRLHDASIAHGQIDLEHLTISDVPGARPGPEVEVEVGLLDFRGATLGAGDNELRTDDAQALVASALLVGVDDAVALALAHLCPDDLARGLPFLQPAALTPALRAALKRSTVDLEQLRTVAAAAAGIDAPALQRMRRVSARSIVQLALMIVAFLALLAAFGGVDFGELGAQVRDARWWLVLLGFVLVQGARVPQAVSSLGASPIQLALRPLYVLQLALAYIGLAVPGSGARFAVNVRYFQRHGLASGTALAVSALDSLFWFIVQGGILLSILLFTSASLELHLDASVPSGLSGLVVTIIGIGVAIIVVIALIPKLRRLVFTWVADRAREALAAARGLRSARRLGQLLGANLAAEVTLAMGLGAFAYALGYPVGIVDLLLIHTSVSLLAGFLPIPGGIGLVESGLTFGLVRAGLPEDTAFAVALLYRMSSFYLPPIWGFFGLRWLERNDHL